MPRPIKWRRVALIPEVTYFKPAGIPLRALEEGTVGSDMPVNHLKYLNENYLGFVVYDVLY